MLLKSNQGVEPTWLLRETVNSFKPLSLTPLSFLALQCHRWLFLSKETTLESVGFFSFQLLLLLPRRKGKCVASFPLFSNECTQA